MKPLARYRVLDSFEKRDGQKTSRTETLIGTAASVLLHLVVLGLLFAIASDQLSQNHVCALPVIQVTLAPPVLSQGKETEAAPVIPSPKRKHVSLQRKPKQGILPQQKDLSDPVTKGEKPVATIIEKNPNIDLTSPTEIMTSPNPPEADGLDSDSHLPGYEIAALESYGFASTTGGSSTFSMPRYLKNPYPQYPHAARMKGQEGLVVLSVRVLENGRVGQVRIKTTSGYAILDQSAMAAVQSWQFEPAMRGNIPQASSVDIPVRFSLKERHP